MFQQGGCQLTGGENVHSRVKNATPEYKKINLIADLLREYLPLQTNVRRPNLFR